MLTPKEQEHIAIQQKIEIRTTRENSLIEVYKRKLNKLGLHEFDEEYNRVFEDEFGRCYLIF
jgi:intein-encoded DNA endonuclease-like protein